MGYQPRPEGMASQQNQQSLTTSAMLWSTPSVADVTGGRTSRSGDRKGELLLNSMAAYVSQNSWPTPTSLSRPRNEETLEKCGAYRKALAGQNTVPLYLEEVAQNWPTPVVTDSFGARNRTSGRRDPNSKHHDGVTLNDAIILYSHPVQATEDPGQMSSPERRTLNPLFVEWLMGWPTGWTASACSATELSRFKRRMRSALSQLTSHAAPPAQLSLFG